MPKYAEHNQHDIVLLQAERHDCTLRPAASLTLLCSVLPRNVWSHAALALSRPDVRYHLLAIDFLPASVLSASLCRLSAALAAGQLQPLPDVDAQCERIPCSTCGSCQR